MRGFPIYRPEHWAFAGTGLYYGDLLGADSHVYGYEVDGLDYEIRYGLPYPTATSGAPDGLEILALGMASQVEEGDFVAVEDQFFGDEDGRFIAETLYGDASDENLEKVKRSQRHDRQFQARQGRGLPRRKLRMGRRPVAQGRDGGTRHRQCLDRYLGDSPACSMPLRPKSERQSCQSRVAKARRAVRILFYLTRLRRPLIDRAEGIYMWTQDGRRFIDGSSGRDGRQYRPRQQQVLDAMKRQMDRATFAYRLHFENEPAEELARRLAGKHAGGPRPHLLRLGRLGSGRIRHQAGAAMGGGHRPGQRWKVISRFPSYHGGTMGSLGVTGDLALTETFAPQMQAMPTIPAPTAYRDRDNLSMEQRGMQYADMLEEKILAEGPESVLAFIMEPIGGAATAALVAPDSYFPRIREICDRYGILLIHDEVMSGVGRTGKFLGGDHWNCRPDIVALSKGIGSGYAPLGAMARTERLVRAGARLRRLPARPHLCRQSARLRRRASRCSARWTGSTLIENAGDDGRSAEGPA